MNADPTPRQQAVLNALAAGETYREMADRMNVTETSCRSHASNALARTGAKSVPHLVAMLAAQAREDDIVMTPHLRAYLRRFDATLRTRPIPTQLLEDLAA